MAYGIERCCTLWASLLQQAYKPDQGDGNGEVYNIPKDALKMSDERVKDPRAAKKLLALDKELHEVVADFARRDDEDMA
jgi:hypothetical protein